MFEIISVGTRRSVTAAISPTTARSPWSSMRSVTSTGCWAWRRGCRSRSPTSSRPIYPQRLRDRRARALPGGRAAYHVNAGDPAAFDRVPAADGDVIEVSRTLAVRVPATPGRTFTHVSYALTSAAPQPGCSPAGRCCTARPAVPTCSAPATAARWWLRSTAPRSGSRLSCPTRRRAADPRVRQLMRRNPVRGDVVDDRRAETGQPGAHPGRAPARRRNPGRAGRLARVLRPHGAGQPRRAGRRGPETRRGGPALPSCGGSRPASGGRPARRPGVRGRPCPGHAQLRVGRLIRTAPPPRPPAAPRSGQAARPWRGCS